MPLPVVVAIVAAVVVLAVLAVRRELGNQKRKAALLVTKGFRPVERPDPDEAEPLLQLYRRGPAKGRKLRLWRAFRRDHRGGGMLVFGVMAPPERRRTAKIVDDAVGIICRGAGFPAFELYAVGAENAPMARFVVPLLTGPLAQGQVVRFDDVPEFSRRFPVLSPVEGGERAVRAALSPELRQALLRFQFFTLLAEGDAIALHADTLSGPGRADPIEALGRTIDEAGDVARVLEEAFASARSRAGA